MRTDSESGSNEDDFKGEKKIKETHNYVDVMAHRMNEIDSRLFKCAIEENLKDKNDEKD